MKRSRYNKSQIIKILKEGESVMPVTRICSIHWMKTGRSHLSGWKNIIPFAPSYSR